MKSSDNIKDFEIDLYDIFKITFQYKKLITIITFSFAILAVVISLFIKNEYTADILLIPASKEALSLADKYGDVASLVGVNIADGGASPVQEAITVLQAKKFLGEFVQKNHLKPILFSDRWNSDTQEWILQRPSIFKIIMSFLSSENTKPDSYEGAPGEPSIWELYEFFNENMQINENSLDGTILMSFTHTDPKFAAMVVNKLIIEINESLRMDFVKRAQNTISYLKDELKTAQVVELRKVLFGIIGENLNNIALAKAQEAYVFKIIDPAIIPEVRSSPNRFLILIISTVLGMIFGIVTSLLLKFRSDEGL